MDRIVEFALKNRPAVVLLFAVAAALGAWRAFRLPVDAFPDTTPVQVQINTGAPALNPLEVEQQITLPIELAISGLPGLSNVRSVSKFGFSQVVATFRDGTDIYNARQFVTERLNSVRLPPEIDPPRLGPLSTGLGEVLHYVVRSDSPAHGLTELRTLHDWVIRPALLTTPGVAEVNSWGGYEKQYHVIVDPEKVIKYGLSLGDVERALQLNNINVSGGVVERAGESLLVHGIGRVGSVSDIEAIAIAAFDGTPVRVSDVAKVQIGNEIRRGAVTFQGEGEAVLGLGFMLLGENSRDVTHNLRNRLDALRPSLPDDVSVQVVYDRTELVSEVITTVSHNLLVGAVLVTLVLFVLLGNVRAGLLVAAVIPLSMLFAVLGMYELAIAASLLSLGAIDFGILVDGSIVMTEANLRRLRAEQAARGRRLTPAERLELISASAREVTRPIVFGMGIIIVVFLPVLTLEGLEGKMFRPMAWTFIFGLLGALLIALFLSPIASYYLLPRDARPERKGLSHLLTACYAVLLRLALRARWPVLAATLALLAASAGLAARLGGEFVPRLSEGALVANVIRLAGVSIDHSVRYNTRIERILLDEFPNEIKYAWSRIGAAEVATDPMGTELTDIFLALHPREHWRRARNQTELVAAVERTLADLPGLNIAYTQPIEMRLNEMISGTRSDVAINIYGDDFRELARISDEIQRMLLTVPGSSDIAADQLTGQPTLQITIRDHDIARYGIPRADILNFVRAVGGVEVGAVYEGPRVFPLVWRLPDEYRARPEILEKAQIPTEIGPQLRLHQLADVRQIDTPSTISREWGRRLSRVQVNVRDRDVASFVDEAKARTLREIALPAGYVVEWGGQFEHLERARTRLALIVPTALILIFCLLYLSLGNLRDVLIIYAGIPFAFIGGVVALGWRDIPFSVSAAIGFIALSGIAVLNGQILVAAIRRFRDEGLDPGAAVMEAAKQRLRPVLATAITDAAGFLPMALSTGVGAEVQRPLATVVIGGVITSTILTLIVFPILYSLGRHRNDDMFPSDLLASSGLEHERKK